VTKTGDLTNATKKKTQSQANTILVNLHKKQMSPCHVHHPKLETTVDERIAALI